MEDIVDDKLDTRAYPFQSQRPSNSSLLSGASVRPSWSKSNSNEKKQGPRLIVFVIGGTCHSEMRSAYEVTQQNKKWEVIMGSDQIITPKTFLEVLSEVDSGNSSSAHNPAEANA